MRGCCIPPQNEITGFTHYMPSEAGYEELRRLFDYLLQEGIIDRDQVVVVDADDMLDNPEGTIKDYCERTGIPYESICSSGVTMIWNMPLSGSRSGQAGTTMLSRAQSCDRGHMLR